MNGKKLACLSGLVLIAAFAVAQDNPVPNFGMDGGSNFRTFVYPAPYIFGDGSAVQVKWKKDVGVEYNARRHARAQVVFDEAGDLYFRTYTSTPANSGKIIKARASDGSFVWAGPLIDGQANDAGCIVGGNAVYAVQRNAGNAVVYAMNKATGALLWQSNPLPARVGLNMALYNGVLYGITVNEGNFEYYAFAVNAATGAILHTTWLEAEGDAMLTGNVCLVPNKFGSGQHGLYWCTNQNSEQFAMYGINISNSTASTVWTSGPVRTATSHVMYNPVKDVVYHFGWGDWGTTAVAYDPLTGAKKWMVSRSQPAGDPDIVNDNFNAGFYPTVTLKPDGSGFVLAGFGGELWSFTDPGDAGGAYLTMLNSDWWYQPPMWMGESQTFATMIADPSTNDWAFVSFTSAAQNPSWDPNLDVKRHLYVQNAKTGDRTFEWYQPGDVAPYNWAYNGRSLAVGPNGDLYYFDAQENAQGTLYCLTAPKAATVSGKLVLEDYDAVAKLTVPITVEIRRASDNSLLDTKTVNVDASDNYTLTTSATGQVTLTAKASHWLAQKSATVDLASPGAVDFSLKNGDVDNDNVVTVFDYNALSDAFDSADGDPNWNAEADLDGDGSVTVFDYNILSTNFDLSGD